MACSGNGSSGLQQPWKIPDTKVVWMPKFTTQHRPNQKGLDLYILGLDLPEKEAKHYLFL